MNQRIIDTLEDSNLETNPDDVLAILKLTKTTIRDEQRWCKLSGARNSNGSSCCPVGTEAISRCLTGAMYAAGVNYFCIELPDEILDYDGEKGLDWGLFDRDVGFEDPIHRATMRNVRDCLLELLPSPFKGRRSLSAFNDRKQYNDVISLVTGAITKLEDSHE